MRQRVFGSTAAVPDICMVRVFNDSAGQKTDQRMHGAPDVHVRTFTVFDGVGGQQPLYHQFFAHGVFIGDSGNTGALGTDLAPPVKSVGEKSRPKGRLLIKQDQPTN